MYKKIIGYVLISLISTLPVSVFSSPKTSAHVIVYEEKEEGTDYYTLTYTVSEDFIRIDDSTGDEIDESGYIIFDLKKQTIYSVSHFDKTILVIHKYNISETEKNKARETKHNIIYEKLEGAPTISGRQVFNYRVMAKTNKGFDKCMDLQIAEGLLTDVTSKLKQYQSVVSGQQVKNIKNTPEEYQTSCNLIDQVYNDGAYYDKGLPVREWHYNNRVRVLQSFDEVSVDAALFSLPQDYRKFTLDELFH